MTVRGFRFRAQPALDLRRREDEEAQGVLARAQAALRASMQALAGTEARAHEARTQCAVLVGEPGSAAQQTWHRSWIVRLDGERAACAAAVTARQQDVARASAARARTHQRLKALERFKEKSAQVWERQLAAEEQKHLDALGTIRFVTGRADARSRTDG